MSGSGSGSDVGTVVALVASGVALGAVAGFLTLGSRGEGAKRHEEGRPQAAAAARPAAAAAKQLLEAAEDVTAGITLGFSMEEAREHADAEHARAKGMTPAEVLSALQRGNTRFWMGAAQRPECSAFERRALISKQFPTTAVLGCSDSRVPVEIVFDQGLGDLFVVRVAGNCLDGTTQGSLEFAVHHLKVKVLMVLGHEGCGAIKASQLPAEDIAKEPACLCELLTGLKGGLAGSSIGDVRDAKARDREAVTTNVKRQVERLTEDDGIMAQVRKGELIIVGAFYEISSGIVDFFHEVTSDYEAPASLLGRQPSRGVMTRFSKDAKA